jgi:hypothetical protein
MAGHCGIINCFYNKDSKQAPVGLLGRPGRGHRLDDRCVPLSLLEAVRCQLEKIKHGFVIMENRLQFQGSPRGKWYWSRHSSKCSCFPCQSLFRQRLILICYRLWGVRQAGSAGASAVPTWDSMSTRHLPGIGQWLTFMNSKLRGPFEKLVDSPYSKKIPASHLHKVPTRCNNHLITLSLRVGNLWRCGGGLFRIR